MSSTGAPERLEDGGSHGFYSVELCRRYSALRATVLDLPKPFRPRRKSSREKGMGERVHHTPGNILNHGLGESVYHVVLIAHLVHHFTNEQNRDLAVPASRRRCAAATSSNEIRPAGWRPSPTDRRAAPGPLGTRRDVSPASH